MSHIEHIAMLNQHIEKLSENHKAQLSVSKENAKRVIARNIELETQLENMTKSYESLLLASAEMSKQIHELNHRLEHPFLELWAWLTSWF